MAHHGKAAAIGAVLTLAAAAFFIPTRQTSSGPGSPQPVVERHAETGGYLYRITATDGMNTFNGGGTVFINR